MRKKITFLILLTLLFTSFSSVKAESLPDYVITDINIEKKSGDTSEYLYVTVKNIGDNYSVNNANLQVWSQEIDNLGYMYKGEYAFNTINNNEEAIIRLTPALKKKSTNIYTFGSAVDYMSKLPELSENNNTHEKTVSQTIQGPKMPDLTITDLKYYSPDVATPKLGDYVGYEVTIKNIGDAEVKGPFEITAILNNSLIEFKIYDNNFILLPNQSFTDKRYQSGNIKFSQEGANILRANIDSGLKIDELNENNNKLEKTITIAAAPEKKPDLSTASIKLTSGDSSLLYWYIKNSSVNDFSGSFEFKIEGLDSLSNMVMDTYIPLAPNAQAELFLRDLKLQPLAVGQYRMKITIDPNNKIAESNEDNNIYEQTISIPSPASADSGKPCIESDNGKNYFKRGGIEGIFGYGTSAGTWGMNSDSCISSNQLTEFYCQDNKVYQETINCELGCKDGKCLSATEGSVTDLELTVHRSPETPAVNEPVEFTLFIKNKGPKDAENIYYQIGYNFDTKSDNYKEINGKLAMNSKTIEKLAVGETYTEKSVLSGGGLSEIKYPSAGTYKVYAEVTHNTNNNYDTNYMNNNYLDDITVKESGYQQCTDSDGGKNIYLKGEVYLVDSGAKKQDQCMVGIYNYDEGWKQLQYHEAEFCDPNSSDGCYVKEYKCIGRNFLDTFEKCVNGCKDGACIKEVSGNAQITQINTSANLLYNNKMNDILSELKQLRDTVKEQQTEIKYLKSMTSDLRNMSDQMKSAINDFITYGVDANTVKLGAGERAAVINSYKAAFAKLPETEAELTDAIKIANGRFPSLTSDAAEKLAKEQFIKIYKRVPDLNDAKDNAAIKVMAYGLRQKAENRNLNSEKSGIKTFKSIYGYTPKTTEDWNTMQAITYSGAAREKDADGDLLSDEMEAQYGTNPNKADTDGDGFKDGVEVNGGFNPRGSGKL